MAGQFPRRSGWVPFVAFLLSLLSTTASRAASLIIPDDFPTIRAGVAASTAGDSLLIRPKRYVEYLVIGHDLSLIGLGAGVVLEGDFNPDSTMVRVLAPARARFASMTIRYGGGPWAGGIKAETGTELHLDRVMISSNGGGCENGRTGVGGVAAAKLIATDCTFEGNIGGHAAGGVAFETGEVRNCLFLNNFAVGHPICGGGPGAAYTGSGECRFESCRFLGNMGEGASAVLSAGPVTLQGCEFTEQSGAADIPTAVLVLDGDASVIDQCSFKRNHMQVALIDAQFRSLTIRDTEFIENDGFGYPLVRGSIDIARTLFARNTGGVAIECWGSSLVENCTIADGIGHASGGIHAVQGQVKIHQSIFSHIPGTAISCAPGVASAIDCNDLWENSFDYEGCAPGPNDFSADPRFCRPGLGDYRVRTDSPCLPPNSPAACGLIGALDVGCAPIGVEDEPVAEKPPGPRLWPPVPSPVRTRAQVWFELPGAGSITLRVYDSLGRAVSTLAQGPFARGRHAAEWDARDARGRPLAAGSYVLCLMGPGFVRSSKLIVLPE